MLRFGRRRSAMMTMKRTWIGVALGLGAVALGSAVCAARIGAKRRRLKDEQEERIATWEGEGGAPMQGTAPAH